MSPGTLERSPLLHVREIRDEVPVEPSPLQCNDVHQEGEHNQDYKHIHSHRNGLYKCQNQDHRARVWYIRQYLDYSLDPEIHEDRSRYCFLDKYLRFGKVGRKCQRFPLPRYVRSMRVHLVIDCDLKIVLLIY